MTFTLCMIVKNEEKMIKRCLDSVKGVFDEIVIVDTGSADDTKKIAREYTEKVYDFVWCDDFSAARNYSFSKASSDYIMWLDADDVLMNEDREKLSVLKEEISPETDVVMMRYAAAFDENGNTSFVYYRERLIKRLGGFMWNGFVHEVITPRGNIVYSDVTICHRPPEEKAKNFARNLEMYEAYIAKGAKLNAREEYYYARELYYNGNNAKAAQKLEEFTLNPAGWESDKAGAFLILYEIYAKEYPKKAEECLAKSFVLDVLSPQTLCLMGDAKYAKENIHAAIFWYSTALICPKEYLKSGFVLPEYEAYYPYMQLCVCYDRLGEYGKAEEYNKLASQIKPDSPEVKYNADYFEKLMKKENNIEKA